MTTYDSAGGAGLAVEVELEGWKESNHAVVTSDAVLLELANFFAKSPLRARCLSAIRRIRASSGCTIEQLTPKLGVYLEAW